MQNSKKNKRPKSRYILIATELSEKKLCRLLYGLIRYSNSRWAIQKMNYMVTKLEKQLYMLKIDRNYVTLSRLLVNWIPRTRSLKTYHTVNKYKQYKGVIMKR